MSKSPETKKVLVTGGTRGIGFACAKAFVENGHQVLAIGRSSPPPELLANLDSELIQFLTCDLDTTEGRAKLKNRLLETSSCEIVVQALGGSIRAANETDSWTENYRLNVSIVAEINAWLIPSMISAGFGRIVHVSSSAAEHGNAFPPYAAAKAALNRYIKSEGRKLAKSGIALCGIMPAAVSGYDGYWDRQQIADPAKAEAVERGQSSGSFQRADDIAKAVRFMCGESGMIFAGCVIPADASIP